MSMDDTPAPAGLKRAGLIAGIAAIAIVAVGAWARFHDSGETQKWADAAAIPTVHLVPVKAGDASSGLALPATMQAWNTAKIFARVGGYVRNWSKDIGANVGAGTSLGEIDTPELDQQIVQARAELARAKADAALAQSTARRWNDLLSTNSVSHQEADEKNGDAAVKQAAVQAAQANLGRLQAMKGFATLRAPFAGTVTVRSAEIGDLVGPGAAQQQPLFAVADSRHIRVYVQVPQTYSAAIKPGLKAALSLPDYPDRSFTAQVIGTAGAIDPQNGTFQTQLVADNPDGALKPGGYAQARFDLPAQASTVQVPASALIFRAAGAQVALVDASNHVRLRAIKIGRDLGQTVEVLSGLSARDKVVDTPPDSLAEGQLVRLRDNNHG